MEIDKQYAKYLDPKNDLTFRKIFGQHPHILKSFLNSLLPLEEGQLIEELEYADPGMIPELPELKHSIVDVRCTDNFGRHFIVEMQMYWTSSFKNRMLFNAGKAYVKQLNTGQHYASLQPVYGLSLVDDIMFPEKEHQNRFYHHYRLAHQEIEDEHIPGIELIFVELPKFNPQTFTEKKVRNLWLRFLTEVNENTEEVSEDLYSDDAIKEALEHLQVSAFTRDELEYYDRYWDRVRVEKTTVEDAQKKEAEKFRPLMEQERKEKEEAQQKIIELAKMLKGMNVSIEEIMKKTGLSREEIEKL